MGQNTFMFILWCIISCAVSLQEWHFEHSPSVEDLITSNILQIENNIRENDAKEVDPFSDGFKKGYDDCWSKNKDHMEFYEETVPADAAHLTQPTQTNDLREAPISIAPISNVPQAQQQLASSPFMFNPQIQLVQPQPQQVQMESQEPQHLTTTLSNLSKQLPKFKGIPGMALKVFDNVKNMFQEGKQTLDAVRDALRADAAEYDRKYFGQPVGQPYYVPPQGYSQMPQGQMHGFQQQQQQQQYQYPQLQYTQPQYLQPQSQPMYQPQYAAQPQYVAQPVQQPPSPAMTPVNVMSQMMNKATTQMGYQTLLESSATQQTEEEESSRRSSLEMMNG